MYPILDTRGFYSGGTYSVNGERRLVLVGIYDPKIIEKICKWEEQGLKTLIKKYLGIETSLEGEDDKDSKVKGFKDKIKEGGKWDQLWNGGGNILQMDIADFTNEVGELKTAFENISGVEISIENIMSQSDVVQ